MYIIENLVTQKIKREFCELNLNMRMAFFFWKTKHLLTISEVQHKEAAFLIANKHLTRH